MHLAKLIPLGKKTPEKKAAVHHLMQQFSNIFNLSELTVYLLPVYIN